MSDLRTMSSGEGRCHCLFASPWSAICTATAGAIAKADVNHISLQMIRVSPARDIPFNHCWIYSRRNHLQQTFFSVPAISLTKPHQTAYRSRGRTCERSRRSSAHLTSFVR